MLTPLECGFNRTIDVRVPVSLRFFIFAVVFVVFDVELVLILPILITLHDRLDLVGLYSIYCFGLGAGLYLE